MADSFDVDVDEYQGIDIDEITRNALDAVATKTQNQWRDNMDQAGYRNTGEAIRSIAIETPEEFVRLIGSDKIQVLIGEVGRAPGSGHPPPDDLGDWVHEQSGLPDRGETVEWEFDGELQEVTFDQVVFLIGRAIDENGLEAHHFGERAVRETTTLDREFERRLQAAVDRQSSG